MAQKISPAVSNGCKNLTKNLEWWRCKLPQQIQYIHDVQNNRSVHPSKQASATSPHFLWCNYVLAAQRASTCSEGTENYSMLAAFHLLDGYQHFLQTHHGFISFPLSAPGGSQFFVQNAKSVVRSMQILSASVERLFIASARGNGFPIQDEHPTILSKNDSIFVVTSFASFHRSLLICPQSKQTPRPRLSSKTAALHAWFEHRKQLRRAT